MLLPPQGEKCSVTHTVFVVWILNGLTAVEKKMLFLLFNIVEVKASKYFLNVRNVI